MASGTITNATKKKTVVPATLFSGTQQSRTIQNYATNKRYLIGVAINGSGGGNADWLMQAQFVGDVSHQTPIHLVFGNGFLQYLWLSVGYDGVVSLANSWKLSESGAEWVDMSDKYLTVWEIG